MRPLSVRLSAIEALIPKGVRVADIGTDHAHLPIALIKSGKCERVIACDIREKPLENARTNIEKTKTVGVELRLGDGLSPVLPEETDYIVIAGMGGEVISGILDSAKWVQNDKYTLLLQPMTSADALRRYLSENSFKILEEKAVLDSEKLYTVIKAAYSGENEPRSEAFYRIGRLDKSDPTAALYIEKQLRIIKKCIADLKDSDNALELSKFSKILEEMEK
ncbi:MAG: SAM-dependent methyltransferase [Clostridia bacterium]|nr:SAM-dependent methyltransferase [Clostridia bacterium]